MIKNIWKYSKYVITLILVIGSGYLAFNKIDLSKLMEVMKNVNYVYVILPIPVIVFSHWLRAYRWKTMLKPIYKDKDISVWNLFSAVMVGYALNSVTPRGGEFLRPFVFSKREKVSYSTSFATIIVERFIDLISLLLLFAGVFYFFRDQIIRALNTSFDSNSILVPTVMVIGVLLLSFYRPFVMFFLKLLIKPISEKLFLRISSLFEKFLHGFEIIRRPSMYFRLTLESLSIWICYTIPMFIVFFAFNFQQTAHLGFDDAILLIVISGIGVTIAPTPGALGVYDLLIKNAMIEIYQINKEEAIAYALLTHGINYFVQVVVGGLFMIREGITFIPKKEELIIDSNDDLINNKTV
ncbi:MAG: lysylphosphatidylglycerol synthase transmembrane domain-containing protein [Candidatus Kapabacteria bacterium]|nr:lysylphosphatidylglycerol synthase transmembrane domain-containing protein [Candidatus Kapabacteria bacterium]